MTPVASAELTALIEASTLFEEFLQLPQAIRYRDAINRSRGWRLTAGERIAESAALRGAYVVLSGRAALAGEAPVESSAPEPADARLVFGQWTGLRGEPLADEVQAVEPTVVMECTRELLHLLLGGIASEFKVRFYLPLVDSLAPLAGTPADILREAIRKSPTTLFENGHAIVKAGEFGNTMFFILEGVAEIQLPGAEQHPRLRRNDFFGEIAVLTNQPRMASVTADGPCLAMECDARTVGDIRKKNKTFKDLMERLYRERALIGLLEASPFFDGLEDRELGAIRDIATLETFAPYEPLFFQGDAADKLFLVVNGTVTVVQETPDGPLPIAWVRSGETVGEMALLPEISGTDHRRQTVAALQQVDAVCIPQDQFREIVARNPIVRDKLAATARKRMEANRAGSGNVGRAADLGWMLDTQHLAGNWVLAVDMNDCIRCNNCVTACQSVHTDGLNRFFWDDMRQAESVLPHVRLSHSCQHCEFALCMRPCPTNAIKRTTERGAVFIDYDACIRCGKCADTSQGCPYGSIQIVPAAEVSTAPQPGLLQLLTSYFRKPEPAPAAAEIKGGKNYPVKCDLCEGLPYQACVQHCPTGAVFRVDGDRTFTEALQHPVEEPGGNRPSGEVVPLYLTPTWAHAPVAGKPAELQITVRPEGTGSPIYCRRPEKGVGALRLNLFMVAPDTLRLGGGGALQQVALPTASLAGETKYPMSCRTAGTLALKLVVYQGGLYLGQLPIEATFAKA